MQKIYSFLFLFLTNIAANAAELRIAVSDLISDDVAEKIQALAEEKSVETSIVSIGSLPAIDYLRADEISLAVIVAPEDMDSIQLPEDTYETLTIAYGTAVVAVNKANPIDEVSFDDLQGIFSVSSDLNVEAWDALRPDVLVGKSIKPLMMQAEKSASKELFRYTVLQGDAIKLTVSEVDDSEIEKLLTNDSSSIAVLPYLPDNDQIKALMISPDPESPAFGPTNNNVYYGDYPIRLPFQIVYKKETKPDLSEIFSVFLSDELTEALKENGLFVLPDAIRKSHISSLGLSE